MTDSLLFLFGGVGHVVLKGRREAVSQVLPAVTHDFLFHFPEIVHRDWLMGFYHLSFFWRQTYLPKHKEFGRQRRERWSNSSSTDSRSGRRSQRERQSAAGHNSWNRMPVLFFLSLRIRHVFSLSIFISVADPQERKGRENSQPWKSSPRTLGLSSLKRVLVSTVNSCSTFQSWDWWCTKGKGKVNRCINLIWKVKNNYPIIPGSGKGKYMRIQGIWWRLLLLFSSVDQPRH